MFPADRIPWVWMKPTAFVFNTDNHTQPGMHWVAIHVDSHGFGHYLDSYGIPPFIPNHIKTLRKNCKHLRWNVKQLQSETSDVCGQYCLMFLHYMTNGLGFEAFLNNFSDDLKKNDCIARSFIKHKSRDNYQFTGNGGCVIHCLQSSSAKMSLL